MTASTQAHPIGPLPGRPGASRPIPAPQPTPESAGIRPDDVIRHGKCGRWWTGRDRNHCGFCHETINSLTGFDAHIRVGYCVPPDTVGLVERQEAWGVLWVYPSDAEANARLKARRLSLESDRA